MRIHLLRRPAAVTSVRPVIAAAALLLTTTLLVIGAPTSASAASGCGTKTTTDTWGATILGNYYKTIEHTASSRACKDSTNITVNSNNGHSCNKGSIAFTVTWHVEKSATIGRSGAPETTNVFECSHVAGLQIKGVGFTLKRDLFIRHRPYVRNASDTAPWVATTIWDTCC